MSAFTHYKPVMVELASCRNCAQVIVGEGRFCASCGADVRPPENAFAAEGSADRLLVESLRRATIGEYEIREELGRGGMATVFLAHDIRLKKKVAIKVLSPHLQLLPGMATRFLREAQTAAAMEHPNIIPIYAYRATADFAFFTMRYVEGASLSAVAKELRQFPISTVRALLWDIGSALSCAHAHGVLHRDVKPGNVLLGRDGSVVVTDFGIAKQTDGHALTLTGQLLGTPAYMSPEQCRGADISFASDQYALGVIAFELLAGRLPFVSQAAGGLMAQHLMEPAPPVLNFRPDCPVGLANAVMRMLLKNPAERFASIDLGLIAAGAVAVLPSDAARLQIRAWAEHPVHARNLADTPLSPLVGSMQLASEPADLATPPPSVAATPMMGTPVHPRSEATARRGASPLGNARWVWFSPAIVAVLVTACLLLLRDRPQAAQPAPTVAQGTLVVDSIPFGAQLFVDDSPVRGPRLVIAAGTHRVRVDAPGFVTFDTALTVVSASVSTVVFAAEKLAAVPFNSVVRSEPDAAPPKARRGALVIAGLPAGGRTFVDGRVQSGSRLNLEPGRHRVRLEAAGFLPVESVVDVREGLTSRIVFVTRRDESRAAPPPPAASAFGVLMLRVRPFARVFVDGAFRSEDELLVLSVQEGRHVLRFEKAGYVSLDATVTVTAGDTLKKSFTIQPEKP